MDLKPRPGRPPIPVETKTLIVQTATENGWRARTIQAELSKFGIHVGLTSRLPCFSVRSGSIYEPGNQSTGGDLFEVEAEIGIRLRCPEVAERSGGRGRPPHAGGTRGTRQGRAVQRPALEPCRMGPPDRSRGPDLLARGAGEVACA